MERYLMGGLGLMGYKNMQVVLERQLVWTYQRAHMQAGLILCRHQPQVQPQLPICQHPARMGPGLGWG